MSKGQGPNGRCPPDRRSGVCSRTWRRARGERGQALVEFALVIPVLMLILLGILKFGISTTTTCSSPTLCGRGPGRCRSTRPGRPVRRCGGRAHRFRESRIRSQGEDHGREPGRLCRHLHVRSAVRARGRNVPAHRVGRRRDRSGYVSLRSQLHGDKSLLRLCDFIERHGASRVTCRPIQGRSLARPMLRSEEARASVPCGRAPRNSS